MSMVALTIAPLLRETKDGVSQGNNDWENWYLGMIPLVLTILITGILVLKGILTWKDPLADAQAAAKPSGGAGSGGGGGGGGSVVPAPFPATAMQPVEPVEPVKPKPAPVE